MRRNVECEEKRETKLKKVIKINLNGKRIFFLLLALTLLEIKSFSSHFLSLQGARFEVNLLLYVLP